MSELIVSALPELRERLVEDGVRRTWTAVVGSETARRARPQRLTNGVLEIAVDNSPWLHELTLRAPDLTAKLHALIGWSLVFFSATRLFGPVVTRSTARGMSVASAALSSATVASTGTSMH